MLKIKHGAFSASYPCEEKLYLCGTNHREGGQGELESVVSHGSGTGRVPDPGIQESFPHMH